MIVKLRARARADLRQIAAYTSSQHGEEQATAYLRAIDAVLQWLAEHPGLGAAVPRRPGLHSYPAGRHRVYFRVDGGTLSVVRVLHQTMDVERHL